MQRNDAENFGVRDRREQQHPPSRYSPLRNNSPLKTAHFQSRDEMVEANYKRVRESCERIASVLGINSDKLQGMVSPNILVTPSASQLMSPGGGADDSIASQQAAVSSFLSLIPLRVEQHAKEPT